MSDERRHFVRVEVGPDLREIGSTGRARVQIDQYIAMSDHALIELMREARLPFGLPGNPRFRSRRSGR